MYRRNNQRKIQNKVPKTKAVMTYTSSNTGVRKSLSFISKTITKYEEKRNLFIWIHPWYEPLRSSLRVKLLKSKFDTQTWYCILCAVFAVQKLSWDKLHGHIRCGTELREKVSKAWETTVAWNFRSSPQFYNKGSITHCTQRGQRKLCVTQKHVTKWRWVHSWMRQR